MVIQMARRTPAGQRKTGPQREDSRNPGGTKGADPRPQADMTGGHGSDESGPISRPRSASSGLEDTRQIQGDPTGIAFEEPENVSANTIKSFDGSDEEAE